MILYLKYAKKWKTSTRKISRHYKLLQQRSRIQNQLQKTVAFLYTNNEQNEKEYRNTFQFIIASRIIKCLGINKGCNWSLSGKLQTTEDRNGSRVQKLKRLPMIMDW
jgi:hypothetical protein